MGNPFAQQQDIQESDLNGLTYKIGFPEEEVINSNQPIPWLIYIFYVKVPTQFDAVAMGVVASVSGDISGLGFLSFADFFSDAYVPMVGGIYPAAGKSISVQVSRQSNTNETYTVGVFGVPFMSNVIPNSQPVGAVAGGIAQIQPYSVGVCASPPGQTLEVLGVDGATVVQTIVLTGYEIAPLNFFGKFIRNADPLVATQFLFKKGNYFG